MKKQTKTQKMISRAQGCLIGQLAGDALGSMVASQTLEQIWRGYPGGVYLMRDGGLYNTIAGQPTDDSEMALLLARMLARTGTYRPETAFKEYQYWLSTEPFSCGKSVAAGIQGNPNPETQSNGAMMRVCPLGIFGANYELSQVAQWAMQDAALTHPHKVCQQANALFTMAIAYAIKNGPEPRDLYACIKQWAVEMAAEQELLEIIDMASTRPPLDFTKHQGWVLVAFQNALYRLLFSSGIEAAVVDTIMYAGDTDTNAAISGALMGAVKGCEKVPEQWLYCLQSCRPDAAYYRVQRPRPKCFWPADVLELAVALVEDKKNEVPLLPGSYKRIKSKTRLPGQEMRTLPAATIPKCQRSLARSWHQAKHNQYILSDTWSDRRQIVHLHIAKAQVNLSLKTSQRFIME